MPQLLVIFAKQPRTGHVKTRLGSTIGMQQAAELYSACCDDLFERLKSPQWQRAIAYSPSDDATEAAFRQRLGPQETLWRQPCGDLGERLTKSCARALESVDRVVVVGTDSPTLPTEFIHQAFAALRHVDCVLGPAMDGGYYLIGLRRLLPELFVEIDWSTPNVLQQTLDRLAMANGSLHLLPPWYDVDEVRDLQLLLGHLKAMEVAGIESPAPRTLQWLMKHEQLKGG